MRSLTEGAYKFYEENVESKIESVSGNGSFLKNAKEIRQFLEKVISAYHIKSITDCPCGDWNWMQHVNLTEIDYIGLDVVKPIIDQNLIKFARNNIKFEVFDLLKEIPPKSDLLICRDLLFHLSLADLSAAANNIKQSGCTYLLTTTFPWIKANTELTARELARGWGYREINVELDPIGFTGFLGEVTENRACFHRKVRIYKL